MRDVAIVSFAQAPNHRRELRNEVEILMPVVQEAVARSGIARPFDFTCSGSSDFLQGQPFAFVMALDAAGAWPPIAESHVEMDGAWALYEAYIRLLIGDIDIALATGSGRSSTADPGVIYPMEMDPYYLAPLGVDAMTFSGLQAQALVGSGAVTERQMAEIAARSRRDAKANPYAQVSGDFDVDALLAEDYVRSPLRRHDLPPITDGASALIIARGDRARELCERPVWITGFAHYAEIHYPGLRDLTKAESVTLAGKAAGLEEGPVEVAELQTAFTHEEPLVAGALGLGSDVAINPSGGPLAGNPIMSTGLVRIIEAAAQIRDHGKQRTLAHSTSGPCLQQNLVCILEGGS